MPRLCITLRACSLYSPCCVPTGAVCTGQVSPVLVGNGGGPPVLVGNGGGPPSCNIHLWFLICSTENRLMGSKTNIRRMRCSQSVAKGKSDQNEWMWSSKISLYLNQIKSSFKFHSVVNFGSYNLLKTPIKPDLTVPAERHFRACSKQYNTKDNNNNNNNNNNFI